jgi:hypothetical protein
MKGEPMKVLMSGWSEEATCQWCTKSKECVTVAFDDGFLAAGHLCWKCLQQAVRVQARKEPKPGSATPAAKGA